MKKLWENVLWSVITTTILLKILPRLQGQASAGRRGPKVPAGRHGGQVPQVPGRPGGRRAADGADGGGLQEPPGGGQAPRQEFQEQQCIDTRLHIKKHEKNTVFKLVMSHIRWDWLPDLQVESFAACCFDVSVLHCFQRTCSSSFLLPIKKAMMVGREESVYRWHQKVWFVWCL